MDLRPVNTYPSIIIAHTITAMPFGFIAVSAALANVDPRLEMASQPRRRKQADLVVSPRSNGYARHSVGRAVGFFHSFDELIIVLFITTLGIDTLPKMMWNSVEHDVTPAVACVAVLLGVLTFVVLSLERFLRSIAERGRATQAGGDAGSVQPAHAAAPY